MKAQIIILELASFESRRANDVGRRIFPNPVPCPSVFYLIISDVSTPPASWRRYLLPHLWIALILTPLLIAGMAGIERWPWSACAMFARYRQPGETRWRFSLLARPSEGEFATIEPERYGLPPAQLWRQFFVHVYGSTDAHLPQGAFPDDTPAAFILRMENWFAGVCAHLQQRRMPGADDWAELRIDLASIDPTGAETSRRTIGIYTTASGLFRHISQ